MLFNSLSFFLFFPITTLIYFLLPHRFRWIHLLICSCFFYAALIPAYLLILFAIILVDYLVGLLIAGATGAIRTAYLIVSLTANIGILGLFKYFDFASDNLHRVAELVHWNYPVGHLGMLLPIGLSFHTFQSMAYVIEVHRGRQQPERHLGIFALYVMFYPQLVAGPIERPQQLLHQLHAPQRFVADRAFDGLRQMLWGMFKKVVVADRLAPIVDTIFGDPAHTGGAALILASWLFAVQIYCDFSGYSEIAIGAARVLGIALMQNFDNPYASRSVAEFWRRWHISLSTWFRDYLYIPLGGSRVSLARWCGNVMLVFLISGLWHGANWTFAAWGALHGIYLISARVTTALRQRLATALAIDPDAPLHRAWQTFATFNLVAFAFIFFRASSLAHATAIFRQMVAPGFWKPPRVPVGPVGFTAYTSAELNISLCVASLVFAVEWLASRRAQQPAPSMPVALRWLTDYAVILLILLLGSFGGRTFIYFQF